MSGPEDQPTAGRPRRLTRAISIRTTYAVKRRRAGLAEAAFHALNPGPRRTLLTIPWPPSALNASRYGHGRPSHTRLRELLAERDERYGEVLTSFETYREALAEISVEKGDPHQPHWRNTLLFGLDGISLYCFPRERRPRRYIEVGSGNSTLFVNRARRDGGLDMEITSIDPHPRREIDDICDRVIRKPFETVGLELFDDLVAGDIVFFDCSHRVFMNSDVTAFFLDVLPELPPGILVGLHDIYLPDDYQSEHYMRWWSEQYMLAVLLLGEPGWLRPLLPCWYVSSHPRLGDRARALHPPAHYSHENPHGLIFWAETLPRNRS
ncbi:MAG TPA: class I SAM-dependent methyltransferase [Solirubrobacteraceae bacterium]|nr:class I SAM-dependent methyltransferase [Solirubrobacteraceae bacterium]